MFWTYFFMLFLLALGGAVTKASGEFWESSDGPMAFMFAFVGSLVGLGIITAVFVWADAIDILARFGA